MKILVFSDSHGDQRNAAKLIKIMKRESYDAVIFCGDGFEEYFRIAQQFPELTAIGVKGNNDPSCPLPMEAEADLGGLHFYVTHGHTLGVKRELGSLGKLKAAAAMRKADVVLFGHTHVAYTSSEDGLHIMNPGALRRYECSYGEIMIENGIVTMRIKEI